MCQRRDLTGRVRDPDEVYQSRDQRQRYEPGAGLTPHLHPHPPWRSRVRRAHPDVALALG